MDTIIAILTLCVALATLIVTLLNTVGIYGARIKLKCKHRGLLRALKRSKLNLEPGSGGYSDTTKRIKIRAIEEGKSYQLIAILPRKGPYLRNFEVLGTHDIKPQAQNTFQEMKDKLWENYQDTSNAPQERAYILDALEFYARR